MQIKKLKTRSCHHTKFWAFGTSLIWCPQCGAVKKTNLKYWTYPRKYEPPLEFRV